MNKIPSQVAAILSILRGAAGPQASNLAEWVVMTRRIERVCAVTLTAWIVWLHFVRAGRAGALWRDEISTFSAATSPSLSQSWSLLAYEPFPLLPHAVVRLWTKFPWLGDTDAHLRALGLVIGIGVLFAIWWSKRFLRLPVPILALALFGLNANVIQWGDSIRGYGLGSLLILLVYGLIWQVVESPGCGRIVLAALVSMLSVQCLYQNAFLLFAICMGGAVVCLRKRLWKSMLAVFGIGALSALSLSFYFPIITAALDLFLPVRHQTTLAQVLIVFLLAASAGSALLLFAWLLCGGICILAAGGLLSRKAGDQSSERQLDLALFSVTTVILGTVSLFLFLKGTGLTTQPWYYIALLGVIALSTDILMEQAATTVPRRIGRLVLAFLVAGITLPITWQQIRVRQTNVDLVASILQERASQGDFVAMNPWFLGITFQRYYRGQAAWATVPPIQELHRVRYDLLKEQMATENALQPVFEAMKKSLISGNRVWVVGNLTLPPEGQEHSPLLLAPHGPGRWDSEYYLRSWSVQLGHFLRSHASVSEQVNLEIGQPVSPYENASLLAFTGWRP